MCSLPRCGKDDGRMNGRLAGFGSSTRGRWCVKMRLGSEVEVKVEAEAGGVRKRRPPSNRRCWDGVSEEKDGPWMDHGSWMMDDGWHAGGGRIKVGQSSCWFPRRCGKLLQPASPDPGVASRTAGNLSHFVIVQNTPGYTSTSMMGSMPRSRTRQATARLLRFPPRVR